MTVKKCTIQFRAVDQPITEPVTKFGGQPVWLERPQWPISRTTGHAMTFVGQIALVPELFGTPKGRMVYLFVAGDEDTGGSVRSREMAETFDPESGENACIVQPDGTPPPAELVTTATGPALVDEDGTAREYAVSLVPGSDPDVFTGYETLDADDEELAEATANYDVLYDPLSENKIGGTPAFIQEPEYPGEGTWKLVLQLDSTSAPFDLNFGDGGIGYLFLAEDGRTARFLWQCL